MPSYHNIGRNALGEFQLFANGAMYRIRKENGWYTATWCGQGDKPKETVYSATTLRELSAKATR